MAALKPDRSHKKAEPELPALKWSWPAEPMTRSSFQNSTQTTPVRVKVSKGTDVGGGGGGWGVTELITFCEYLSCYRKN